MKLLNKFKGGQRQKELQLLELYIKIQNINFDEATSALDNKSEEIVSQVIQEVSKQRVTL